MQLLLVMNISLRLFLLLFTFLTGLGLKAQPNFSINFTSTDDTAYYYNDTIRAVFSLTHSGTVGFQGDLQLGYRTVNSGVPISDTVPGFVQALNMQSQETIDISVNIPVSPSFFLDGGGHTVIVWPAVTPFTPNTDIDSVGFYVNILGWLSNEELAAVKQVRLFPVPASDFVRVEKAPELPAGDITLFDLKGRALRTIRSREQYTEIPLTDLPPGLYFIRYSDGVKPPEMHRFIKR